MFYVSVFSFKGKIYDFYRDAKGDKILNVDDNFSPELYVNSKDIINLGFPPSMIDNFEAKLDPTNKELAIPQSFRMYEYYKFIDKHKDELRMYNKIGPKYEYIRRKYGTTVDFIYEKIKVAIIDIENPIPEHLGFNTPEDAKYPINTITLYILQGNDIIKYTFTDKVYSPDEDILWYYGENECEMLTKFVEVWNYESPDIVTGWFIEDFDLPHIIKRLKLNGLDGKLSPIGQSFCEFNEYRSFKSRWSPKFKTRIYGVEIADYVHLMKTYNSNNEESFKLDFIGEKYVNANKVDHPYRSLYELYEKDFQLFMKYNIQDVDIILQLENKFKFIRLHCIIAYLAKVNFEDAFSSVKSWEVYLYNILNDNGYVLPSKKIVENASYTGAWTDKPKIGFHEWITSLDLDSLYPHVIMQYNMSFETRKGWIYDYMPHITSLDKTKVDERILNQEIDLSFLKDNNLTMTANGVLFDMNEIGIIPKILGEIYDFRKSVKKLMIEDKNRYERYKTDYDGNNPDNLPSAVTKEINDLISDIASKDALQKALKVFLNKFYGAVGNESFVFFDVDYALGVTLSAQLSIKWTKNYTLENVDKRFEYDVIYGDTDSVSGDSKITIMDDDDNVIDIRLDDLYKKALKYGSVDTFENKVIVKLNNNIKVLCFDSKSREKQFRSINYIMYKENTKTLYKVSFQDNEVVMTEDHSMVVYDSINDDIIDISPSEIDTNIHQLIL